MKIKHFAVLLLIVAAATGCKEDSPEPVPVAPILKYVVMPSDKQFNPGNRRYDRGTRLLSRGRLYM